MDAARFDLLTRRFVAGWSRRGVLRLGAIALGAQAVRFPDRLDAKKKQKPPALNEYGCLNIGQGCRGKNALCCSGICAGKKPKKGKRDKRKCVAHNTGGCVPAQDSCALEQNVPCGTFGACTVTTGRATFCAGLGIGECTICKKDSDCLLAGPGAACIVCPSSCPATITACFAPAA